MAPETVEPSNYVASERGIGFSGSSTRAKRPVPSGKRCRDSIRFRLASLVIACVLPLWIVAGVLVFHNYQGRRALTEQRMLETTRALSMVVDLEFTNIEASLSALAATPALVSGNLPAFYRQAQTVLGAYQGAYILLADAAGQELVNTIAPIGTPLPKHSVVEAVRHVFAAGKPVITNVFKGVFTGRYMVSVHVPVFRGGRVVYDLAMNVPSDRFATILSQQNIPPGWTGVIFDSNQVIVARNRLAGQFVGQQPHPPLLRRIRDTAEGTVENINLEGIPVVNGFSRSVTSGWTVSFGVPKAIMMREIWHWLWWTIAGTVLLSFTGIAMALPIGRSVEKIERGSRRLSAIVQSSDDAIIGTTLDGIVESWNHGAEHLYGYSSREMVGRHIPILIPDQNDDLPDILRRVRGGGSIDEYRTIRKHKNGSLIPVALKISPVFDHTGTIAGASAIARDITNLKKAEDPLRESEERFQLSMEATSDGLWDWTIPTGAAYFSPGYYRMLGYEVNAFPSNGGRWMDLIHPGDREHAVRVNMDCVEGRSEQFEVEFRMKARNGGWRWILGRGKCVARDTQGRALRLVGTHVDITERKQVEQEREVTIEFLRLVNAGTGTQDLIHAVTTFLQKQSGCEAVGIRLREGDDCPYFEARGFPKEFVLAENRICARDDSDKVIRDSTGNPILECMCGNIISGCFDPSKPFFTARGSFWTNSTTELLAGTIEADRQSMKRNRCNSQGYESVALVPLYFGEERFGLLQLNDRRTGQFSPGIIALFERLADQLAIALAKFRTEKALRESEDRFRKVVEGAPVGMCIESDGLFQYLNPAAIALFGAGSTDNMVGQAVLDRIHPDSRAAVTEHIRTLRENRKSISLVEDRHLRLDGTAFDAELTAMPFAQGKRNDCSRNVCED